MLLQTIHLRRMRNSIHRMAIWMIHKRVFVLNKSLRVSSFPSNSFYGIRRVSHNRDETVFTEFSDRADKDWNEIAKRLKLEKRFQIDNKKSSLFLAFSNLHRHPAEPTTVSIY